MTGHIDLSSLERWMVEWEHGDDEAPYCTLSWVTPSDPTEGPPETGEYLVRLRDVELLLHQARQAERERLEQIIAVYNDDSLTNGEAQDKTYIIASDALASLEQEGGRGLVKLTATSRRVFLATPEQEDT